MGTCPECGGAIFETITGSSQTFTCAACGWSIARSRTEPINEDETIYVMGLIPGQIADKAKLSAVSKIAGCNFIAAKKLIEDGCSEIVSCKAREMRHHIEAMCLTGVDYEVIPEFPC